MHNTEFSLMLSLNTFYFPKVNPLFNAPSAPMLEVSLNYSVANSLNFFIFSPSGKLGFMYGFIYRYMT